jgi:hypothetical protein
MRLPGKTNYYLFFEAFEHPNAAKARAGLAKWRKAGAGW